MSVKNYQAAQDVRPLHLGISQYSVRPVLGRLVRRILPIFRPHFLFNLLLYVFCAAACTIH